MKIRAIVVDDERNAREVLQTLLKKFCPEVEVVGEAPDVETAYQVILSKKPDLIFLDVEMSTGNGFMLLKKFERIPFSVIFITSYDQYALSAIKFSAIDYILKPVEVSELKEAVGKVISKKADAQLHIVNLLENIGEDNPEKKIPVHVHGNVRFITTSTIMYIEADGTYAVIHGAEGEKFASSKSLKDFEELLVPNPSFIRINKSILLNVKYIREYSKGDPFIITLNSGSVFESSRRRKPEVLERLKKLS